MKRKTIWLLVSCLMILSLLIASCAPATETEEEVEEDVVDGAEMVRDVWGTLVEKPQSGGVFTYSRENDPRSFDSPAVHEDSVLYFVEALLRGDYAKGPSGSGDATWMYNTFPKRDNLTNVLATGWELRDPSTLVINVREGVRFHNKPPTNGREMTAEDVAFSIRRAWTVSTGYYSSSYPWDSHWDGTPEESIAAEGKYTVVMKNIKPDKAGVVWEKTMVYYLRIMPKDALEEFGDMLKWENAIGTGPFTVDDYLMASSLTYNKNPDYWGTHPLFPQEKMPFLDSIKVLIIPDRSTQIAALRSRQIDWMGGTAVTALISLEELENLKETNPDLMSAKRLSNGNVIFWRLDNPELPINDLNVRRALNMAIDQEQISQTLYKGQAELLYYPLAPILEFKDVFTSIEDQPADVRELFEYNPEKARQLLDDAGFPDGFQTSVVVWSQIDIDMLSIVKDYWEKIDVDLVIDVKEYGAFVELTQSIPKRFDEGAIAGTLGDSPFWHRFGTGNKWNYGSISDPVIDRIYEDLDDQYWDEDARYDTLREFGQYMPQQAYGVSLPAPYLFIAWQPWVKSYSGEVSLGYYDPWSFAQFVWIDQDLKKEITGN